MLQLGTKVSLQSFVFGKRLRSGPNIAKVRRFEQVIGYCQLIEQENSKGLKRKLISESCRTSFSDRHFGSHIGLLIKLMSELINMRKPVVSPLSLTYFFMRFAATHAT